MRVAIVTNNYLPNPYGVTSSIETFRVELEKHGHDVFIFAPRWKGYVDRCERVFRFPSVEFPGKIRFPVAIPFSLEADTCVAKIKPDVIHAQHPNVLGLLASKWSKRYGIPLVFTWHAMYERYGHFGPPLVGGLYARRLVQRAVAYANAADAMIAPSRALKTYAVGHGVAEEKIHLVPSGVSFTDFENHDGRNIRHELGIPRNARVLVSLSRLTEEKNIVFLARCICVLLQKNPDVFFLLIGEGDQKSKVEAMGREAGVSKRLLLPGKKEGRDRGKFLAAGDVFVYASLSETQGIAVAEALYCGLPVVAVRASGIEDAVADKITGLLTQNTEENFISAVQTMLDNTQQRLHFSRDASQLAKKVFAPDICASRLLEVYNHVLAGGKPKKAS